MKSVFKSYYFWALFIALSLVSGFYIKKFFPQAFPLINVDIKMNREEALASARELTQKYGFLPTAYNQVATFDTDSNVQIFVELDAGGVQAFTDMMQKDLYMPYAWEVRHYKEYDEHETHIFFKPDGTPYGFNQQLAEQDGGADLSETQARAIAERDCKNWNVDLTPYTLIEKSKEVRPSKRSDHTFVYQRTKEKIGEGFYRLKLEVSGDKLTQVMHYIKIPESFTLRYKELRSANTSIATAATIAMIILYIFGSIITLLFFIRHDFIKPVGIMAASILAFLQLLSQLSKLPLSWAYYNTAIGSTNFIAGQMVNIMFSFCYYIALYSFTFCVAEALTRKAFGSHIQFWKIWTPAAASSWQVWGRTIAGYLVVPLHITFGIFIYIVAQKYFGWWVPAGTLTDPNIIAEYAPWLSAVTNSLSAGFWEESLFRAIPLAIAALWGQRFGKKNLWIAAAFIIQAIIFGAAHANYTTLPSYARLVELIVPSSMFGGLYLAFGLLPAIIAHVIYDVFWFAMPLFISHASGAWINQILVILLSLIPVFVIIYARIRRGSWHELAASTYNKAYEYSARKAFTFVEEAQTIIQKRISTPLLIIGIAGACAAGIGMYMTKNYAPALSLSRTDAIIKARESLSEKGITLSNEWEPLTMVINGYERDHDQHLYVWQTAKDLYESLLSSYLTPTRWVVRFVRFTGTPSERAEEYQISLIDSGTVLFTNHILPEDRAAKSLSKEEARIVALKNIENTYHLNKGSLKEISAQEIVHPARKDWLFIFADTSYSALSKDAARIELLISGNEIARMKRFIKPPEDWKRTLLNTQSFVGIIKQISFLFFAIVFFLCLLLFLARFAPAISVEKVVYFGLAIFGIYLLSMLNNWPATKGWFNTAAPISHQAFKTLGMSVVYYAFLAAVFSCIANLIVASHSKHTSKKTVIAWLVGLIAGIAVAGIDLSAFSLLINYAQPMWADFSPMGSYIPVASATNYLISWLFLSCAITLIMGAAEYLCRHLHTNRSLLGIVVALILIISNANRTMSVTTPLVLWLVLQIACVAAFLVLYEWYLRYDYALIGVALAAAYCVALIQQAFFNVYPFAPITSLLGIAILLVASWYWFKFANRIKK